MKRYVLGIFILLVIAIPAGAQDFYSGFLPFGSYQVQDVDSVNLQNLNLVLDVPIISYPQMGTLPNFSFLATYNSPLWYMEQIITGV